MLFYLGKHPENEKRTIQDAFLSGKASWKREKSNSRCFSIWESILEKRKGNSRCFSIWESILEKRKEQFKMLFYLEKHPGKEKRAIQDAFSLEAMMESILGDGPTPASHILQTAASRLSAAAQLLSETLALQSGKNC